MNPAQLHHILREYSCAKTDSGGWTPPPADAEDAARTGASPQFQVVTEAPPPPALTLSLFLSGDILESFDRHPPLILPGGSFQLELCGATMDPALFQQLRRLQALLRRPPSGDAAAAEHGAEEQGTGEALLTPTQQAAPDPVTCPSPEAGQSRKPHPDAAQARGSDLSGCEAVLAQKLKSLELRNCLPGQADLVYHKSLALDPSCLLTPPNTPQGSELGEAKPDLREGARQQHKGTTAGQNLRPKRDQSVIVAFDLLNPLKNTVTSKQFKAHLKILGLLSIFIRNLPMSLPRQPVLD